MLMSKNITSLLCLTIFKCNCVKIRLFKVHAGKDIVVLAEPPSKPVAAIVYSKIQKYWRKFF